MKKNFTSNIINLKTIDSTNQYLKDHYETLPTLSVVKSEYQTNGYGKFKSEWESKHGENLLFSILIKEEPKEPISDLTPKIVNAIILTLAKYHVKASFKIPNDVYIFDKKIAGILIETKYNQHHLDYIIIGIGLNINQETFQIPKAISMKNILQREVNMNDVFIDLLHFLTNQIYGE